MGNALDPVALNFGGGQTEVGNVFTTRCVTSNRCSRDPGVFGWHPPLFLFLSPPPDPRGAEERFVLSLHFIMGQLLLCIRSYDTVPDIFQPELFLTCVPMPTPMPTPIQYPHLRQQRGRRGADLLRQQPRGSARLGHERDSDRGRDRRHVEPLLYQPRGYRRRGRRRCPGGRRAAFRDAFSHHGRYPRGERLVDSFVSLLREGHRD